MTHQLDRGFDLVDVAFHFRLIGFMLVDARVRVHAFRELHVLRNIDDDGPRPAGLGDVERLVHHAR